MKLVSVNKVDTNVVALEVTVGAEEFKPMVDMVYRKYAPQLAIPGFRKGKAPRAFVEKQYGDSFIEEAVNNLYPRMYEMAVMEANIQPVDSANVEIKDVTAEGFAFTATVTVKPEVTVNKYKGLTATKAEAVVEDSEVEKTLDELRQRAARLITVEGRAAQDGDIANLDFEGFTDGVAFEGGKGEGVDLTLGSGQFIPGFEEQVVGHNVGDSFDVNVTFPEVYHSEELKGKPAVFKCTLNALKARELPVIDDEFVKDISEFDTLDELKADIKSTLQERAQKKCDDEFENQLVTGVIENTEIDLPQCMIDRRVDEMVQDFDYRLQSQGMNLQTYMQYTGDTLETFRKAFSMEAERHVRIRLALEKIAEMEKLEAADEELEAEYNRLAEMYGMKVEELKNLIPLSNVYQDVVVNKAIDIIRDNAVVEGAKAPKKTAAKKPAAKKTTKKAEGEEEAAEAPKKKTTRKKKTEEPAE